MTIFTSVLRVKLRPAVFLIRARLVPIDVTGKNALADRIIMTKKNTKNACCMINLSICDQTFIEDSNKNNVQRR